MSSELFWKKSKERLQVIARECRAIIEEHRQPSDVTEFHRGRLSVAKEILAIEGRQEDIDEQV